jgi:protein gp37
MDYANWCKKGWPSNVWLGVTVENQEQADKRIPLLLEIPVKTRFLSMEPLLGAVDLYRIPGALGYETSVDELPSLGSPEDTWSPGLINWTICGGESGPNARPMDLAWARSLRDQCKAGQVPFLMKQILEKGKKVPVEQWPVDLVVKEFPNEKHRQVANQEAQGL